MASDNARFDGTIVASYGRRYRVATAGEELDCVTRGRRSDYACGDRVSVARTAPGLGLIDDLQPRTTLLYRSDAYREKLIAANVTQVVFVAAALPPPHESLLNRCLVAAEHGGIRAKIVLNKADLPEHDAVREALKLYEAFGYEVVSLSAKRDMEPLRARLHGHSSVLVGQSGVGKSTIINGLQPAAAARTDDMSRAHASGRHTTTHAQLYRLDGVTSIIDSPGMQAFGLHHIDAESIAHAFIEFRPYIGQCRFRDCRHLSEPECAIRGACDAGGIAPRRLHAYQALMRERMSPKQY
jgi:ribosome biogenesis GTPase